VNNGARDNLQPRGIVPNLGIISGLSQQWRRANTGPPLPLPSLECSGIVKVGGVSHPEFEGTSADSAKRSIDVPALAEEG